MNDGDLFRFPFEAAIEARAQAAGLVLGAMAIRRLADHARLVLRDNARLHLTAIVEPEEFVERHLGEAFEGAAALAGGVAGTLLDLGSGNGYPGIPIAVARPGLRVQLAESSAKKGEFLRRGLDVAGLADGGVLAMTVRSASDLHALGPIDVIVTRAMGGWERIVPKLAPAVRPGGVVLIWAGEGAVRIVQSASWARLRLVDARRLPGRDSSWIYRLERIQD